MKHEDVVATAALKYVPMSATKITRLLGLVRRKTVREGLAVLRALPHRAARAVEGLVASAAANASCHGHRDTESLVIHEIRADFGPMRKRIRAKSRGMAYVERNRTSHITCALKR